MTVSRTISIIMMVFRGIIRKFGLRRLLFLLFGSLFLFLVLHSSIKPNVRDMLELYKCPACYGVSLCNDILQGPDKISIEFDFWGRLGLLANTFTTKNVYSGWYNHQRVIIKRLGHDFELQNMDSEICQAMETDQNCGDQMKSVVYKVSDLRNAVERLLNESANLNDYRLRLCPSTEHVDTLFSPVLPKTNGTNPAKLGNDPFSANVWTLLLINPEPLLLQIMRAADGWPVPHYLGACGRIVVALNAGEPLIDYHRKSWPERAGLALQLLLAADRFTYSHPKFAFYLLDASADNVVVNDEGKLSFIDLEHFVVVDRHPSSVPDMWNETHFSELYIDCPGCNTFSPYNICNHHISDHNHFMICQLLAPGVGSDENYLPGGLLHSLPPAIQREYPQMEKFLNECATGATTDHIRSARRLRDILNIASKESPLFGDRTLVNTWKYF